MRKTRGGRIMRERVRLALTARRFIFWHVQKSIEAFARKLDLHAFDGFGPAVTLVGYTDLRALVYKDLEG